MACTALLATGVCEIMYAKVDKMDGKAGVTKTSKTVTKTKKSVGNTQIVELNQRLIP